VQVRFFYNSCSSKKNSKYLFHACSNLNPTQAFIMPLFFFLQTQISFFWLKKYPLLFPVPVIFIDFCHFKNFVITFINQPICS